MHTTYDQAKKSSSRWRVISEKILAHIGVEINGSKPYDLLIHDPRFFKRVIQHGSLGLGESYMEGWWDCNRLDQFFEKVLDAGLDTELPRHLADIAHILWAKICNLQSKRRAWAVGKAHYDLGNDLFSAILDPYMQYSCGYWKSADSLAHAQVNKLRLVCEKLQLQPGQTLLDIGCGWGGLAKYAAQEYGVSVHGLTISKAQQKLAMERCKGLDVKIELMDYRDLTGSYDKIVSVGMFEHVGPKNYGMFFSIVNRVMHDHSLFLLHTIGSLDSGYEVDPWTNKYIFPNGCLPSASQITNSTEKKLVMEDWHNFGADYDKTLLAWCSNFEGAWPELKQHYSEQFYRMFRYYLLSCAGAFRARNLQLWQIVYSLNGVKGGIRVGR